MEAMETMSELLAQAEAREQSARGSLAKVQKETHHLNLQLNRLHEEASSRERQLSDKLEASTRRIDDLAMQLDRSHASIRDMQLAHDEQLHQTHRLQSELHMAHERLRAAERSNHDLEQRVEAAADAEARLANDMRKLSDGARQQSQREAALLDQLGPCRSELHAVTSRAEGQMRHIDELTRSLHEMCRREAHVEEQLATHQSNAIQLESHAKLHKQQAADAVAALEHARKHIVTLESAVEELRSTLAADRQRLTESEAAVRQLKSRADESARLNEIQAETSALAQKQAAAAAAELERKADECLAQKRAIDKLERALGDAEESASAQRKRAELEVQLQLRTVLSDGERACSEVSARLAREQAENARLAERARSLEEALLKMTHARDAADEERSADRARVGRQLSDALQELEAHRTKSAAHEQQWHDECESGMRRHSSPVGQPRDIVRA
jgi:chromosome segregation ATPase